MSRRIANHRERAPSQRVSAGLSAAIFFPGEVATLLGLDGIEYGQLRRMFVLARTLRGEPMPGRGWSRFTLADLAATEVLLGLGGGRELLRRGRHLILGDVEQACLALRRIGIENPLLQVSMAREGRRILARVGEYVFEPISGQLVLEDAGRRVDDFLQARIIEDRAVRAAIGAERQRVRPKRRLVVAVGEERGTIGRVVGS